LRKKNLCGPGQGISLPLIATHLKKNHDRTEENGNNLEKEMWIVLAEEWLPKSFNVGDGINEANDDN
jgi:hypothetical protein